MYDSKRVTISYPAVQRLTKAFNLPDDLPSQTLAGYIEQIIFECLCFQHNSVISQPVTASVTEPLNVVHQSEPVTPRTPNLSKIAAMASRAKTTNEE